MSEKISLDSSDMNTLISKNFLRAMKGIEMD